jgi:hypothetical protein
MLLVMKIAGPRDSGRTVLRIFAATTILAFTLSGNAGSHSAAQIAVDLHPYGFPTATDIEGPRLGIFYLSKDRLALFFEQQQPAEPKTKSNKFQVLIFNIEGQKTAETAVHGDPKALDITAGPDGGVAVGKAGQLDFHDSKLRLARSVPLPTATTAIEFDRQNNQLVIQGIDRKSAHRFANFLDAKTLEQSASLAYPINARAVFGKDQLVYMVSGECKGAARIVSSQRVWQSIDNLPMCDSLAFIGNNELAYAFDGDLYIVDAAAKQVFRARIPVGGTFESPALIGLSDDYTRLAISALAKKPVASGWPYHDQVLLYDLVSKRLIFRHALPQTPRAAALSPDGHQLATIEQGTLVLIPVP